MLTETKVKMTESIDGKLKKRVETFVLDCEFFSQAEYTVTSILNADSDENGGTIHEFEIQSIRWSTLKEVATQYQGAYSFIATLKDLWTEDDGTQKSLRYKILLWADDLSQATERVRQLARQGYDMQIEGLKEVNYTYQPSIIGDATL